MCDSKNTLILKVMFHSGNWMYTQAALLFWEIMQQYF